MTPSQTHWHFLPHHTEAKGYLPSHHSWQGRVHIHEASCQYSGMYFRCDENFLFGWVGFLAPITVGMLPISQWPSTIDLISSFTSHPHPAARPKQSPRATAGLSVWLLLTVDGHLGNVVLPNTKITAPFLSSVRFKDFLPRPWTGNTTSRGNQDFTSVMDCSPMACLGHTGLSEWPTVYLKVTDCSGNEHCAVIKRRPRQCTQWLSTCHE
ncbi:uncharacterized protein B0T23DRAFT_81398 [Neurospora hispaniola]|uniref:Uncharacterized protein n=1 Tax=Neurospora hispaniola TaxID=588809 RepID=A0AAJ0ICP5_9PEZI|nr:hypothetical protein B0T23DRAFT_81398 [Neurospora hispaniola]